MKNTMVVGGNGNGKQLEVGGGGGGRVAGEKIENEELGEKKKCK